MNREGMTNGVNEGVRKGTRGEKGRRGERQRWFYMSVSNLFLHKICLKVCKLQSCEILFMRIFIRGLLYRFETGTEGG